MRCNLYVPFSTTAREVPTSADPGACRQVGIAGGMETRGRFPRHLEQLPLRAFTPRRAFPAWHCLPVDSARQAEKLPRLDRRVETTILQTPGGRYYCRVCSV